MFYDLGGGDLEDGEYNAGFFVYTVPFCLGTTIVGLALGPIANRLAEWRRSLEQGAVDGDRVYCSWSGTLGGSHMTNAFLVNAFMVFGVFGATFFASGWIVRRFNSEQKSKDGGK